MMAAGERYVGAGDGTWRTGKENGAGCARLELQIPGGIDVGRQVYETGGPCISDQRNVSTSGDKAIHSNGVKAGNRDVVRDHVNPRGTNRHSRSGQERSRHGVGINRFHGPGLGDRAGSAAGETGGSRSGYCNGFGRIGKLIEARRARHRSRFRRCADIRQGDIDRRTDKIGLERGRGKAILEVFHIKENPLFISIGCRLATRLFFEESPSPFIKPRTKHFAAPGR